MRRLAFAVALFVGVGVVVPAAGADPINQFQACTAFTVTAAHCHSDVPVAVEAGGRVDLRVRVVPAHAGATVNLVRIRPPGTRWVHVATLTLGLNRRAHYLWRTTVADIRGRDYRFQFRLPGHGTRSNVLGIAVIHTVE